MSRTRLEEYDKAQLLEEIDILKKKLNKKKAELKTTRSRLANYKERVRRSKATIAYQRSRILQLYAAEKNGPVV
jgi:hypothetical protein